MQQDDGPVLSADRRSARYSGPWSIIFLTPDVRSTDVLVTLATARCGLLPGRIAATFVACLTVIAWTELCYG